MKIFFDSSALAKRYLEEKGSEQVESLCGQASHVLVSIICLPEILSALNRKKREGIILPSQYTLIKQTLLKEFEDFLSCLITPQVLSKAIDLMEKYPLRTLDALHLACALEIKTDMFVTSDQKQLSAARKLKLKVLDV